MIVVRTIGDVRRVLEPRRGGRIGFVPTMGALHAGHEALVRAARADGDTVVVSIFVNPSQFNDPRDLERYPRDEARDVAAAERAGADVVFVPAAAEMYPDGFCTSVEVAGLGDILEGAFRPGHFRGVATVCLKLFSIVQPQTAWFGQKDAQQVEVVRRMVRDLNLPLDIRVVPTVRDADGLALSSRNVLLSPADRERARALPEALFTKDVRRARERLAGFTVDYLEVAPFEPPVLAAAIRIGGVRLIDNVPLEGDRS